MAVVRQDWSIYGHLMSLLVIQFYYLCLHFLAVVGSVNVTGVFAETFGPSSLSLLIPKIIVSGGAAKSSSKRFLVPEKVFGYRAKYNSKIPRFDHIVQNRFAHLTCSRVSRCTVFTLKRFKLTNVLRRMCIVPQC